MPKIVVNGRVLDMDLKIANTLFSKLLGWIGQSLCQKDALLITNCNRVHTMGMKEPIDIVFICPLGKVIHSSLMLNHFP